MQNQKSTKSILSSYFSYLILFVGSAFISGAIVHSGNVAEVAKYAVIGVAGVSLFIAGSFIQEFILNKENLKEEGIVKFFFFSLLLSIGIGMISGGTQHYSDFPTYSSYLIPLGLVLSLIAYLLKNNYYITSKLWATIVGVFLLISLPLHFGLITLANNLNAQSALEKAAICAKKTSLNPFTIQVSANEEHGAVICPTGSKMNSPHDETTTPHNEVGGHDEDSTKTTAKSNCPAGQSDKSMPGMCHPDDSMSMSKESEMSGMMMQTSQVKDDKSFIEYVIPHHQDAVDGSTKVLTTTQDPELKAFLNNVITNQGKEITMLKGYYKTWFGKEYTPNPDFKSMMKFDGLTEVAIDKAYVQGMLGHHSGIINVAKMVLANSKTKYKPEILTLSKQIIKDQEADNIVLNKWLDSKFKSTTVVSSVTASALKTNIQTPVAHYESDGHKD